MESLLRTDFHRSYLWLRALENIVGRAPVLGTLGTLEQDDEFADIFRSYTSPYKA